MGGGAVLDVDNAGEVADGERGVSEIPVDVDVAEVAGGLVVGEPEGHRRALRRLRLRLLERGGQCGDRRGRLDDVEPGLEHAHVEVPHHVCLVQHEVRAGHDNRWPDLGTAASRLPLERACLLDQFGEAGILPHAGEIGIFGYAVRIMESELYGLLQLVEGGRLRALRERAGEVVVPGGVAGKDFQRLAADFLHLGGVVSLERGNHLLAQLHVSWPDLGHPPDGQRFFLGGDCGHRGEQKC